jgi:hypothetical protein
MLQNRTICDELLDNEDGGLSIEQIMWLGAGLVILGTLVKVTFPKIWQWFNGVLGPILNSSYGS